MAKMVLEATPELLHHYKELAFRHFIQWFTDQEDEDHAAAIAFNVSAAEMVKGKLLKRPESITEFHDNRCAPLSQGDGHA